MSSIIGDKNSKSQIMSFLSKPIFTNNSRSFCLKKSIQIVFICSSCSKKPKIIRFFFQKQYCSHEIIVFPFKSYSIISSYSYCAFIAPIFVISLFAKIEASLLKKLLAGFCQKKKKQIWSKRIGKSFESSRSSRKLFY